MLSGWLEERATTIYPNEPGYDPKQSTVFSLDMDVPQELPDALRGESWCFVQLPLGDLLQELEALPEVCVLVGVCLMCGCIQGCAFEYPPHTH